MLELVSNPKLPLYISQLEGTLKYALTRDGKVTKEYEISDLDFEDRDPDSDEEEPKGLKLGTDTSAIGLQVRTIKAAVGVPTQAMGLNPSKPTKSEIIGFSVLQMVSVDPVGPLIVTPVKVTDSEMQTLPESLVAKAHIKNTEVRIMPAGALGTMVMHELGIQT